MRTRTGWLALLTVGLALTPTAARAQAPDALPGLPPPRAPIFRGQIGGPPLDYDVPREDPINPLPLYHDRPETGGFYVAGEFVFMRQTNPIGNQLIAVRGILDADGSVLAALGGPGAIQILPCQNLIPGCGLVGNFIGSGTEAVNTKQVGGETYVPGWRATIGYRFREGYTIEANWTHLFNARYIGGATLVPYLFQNGPLLADSFLFAPVFNFPPTYAGPTTELAVGNPLALYGVWNGAEEMSLKFEQRYDEYNIGGRVPIVEDECNRCYGLVGMRHVWLWERFKWRTVDYDNNSQAGPDDSATYINIVSNPMYGPYMGCGYECYLGHGFSIALDMNAAIMCDFVREQARYMRNDRVTVAKRDRREYKFVPELEAEVDIFWYPLAGIEIRVGYDFKAFFNTIASPNPVSFNFSGLNPPFETRAFRMVDGIKAGIGFIF